MGRRQVVGMLGAVALAATTACSLAGAGEQQAAGGSGARAVTASDDVPVAEAAPPRLSASVVQYRRDAQGGVLQVKVANEGDVPVRVRHVRLDTSAFTGPVQADKDSRVAPGVSADLTVPLGDPACDPPDGSGDGAADGSGDGVADGSAARHTVTLDVDGTTVELPVGGEVLEPVAAERCATLAVAEQVRLAVAPQWADAGQVRGAPALRGTVVVTPQPGAGRLRLAVEGATTLFTVAEPSGVELPAGAAGPVALDVVLTVTRCDPHAVAEDKKGYLLPVRVSLDGAEEVLVEVAVPVPERAPLQDLIDRTCGS